MPCLSSQQCSCHLQAAAADKTAKQRLGQLDTQLNELKKEQAELTKQWEKEKEEMQRLQKQLKEAEEALEKQAVRPSWGLEC